MVIIPEDVDNLLGDVEGENLEFKEAKSDFAFDKLAKYGSALANEGGGKLVLGVTDRRPRRVVGSRAYEQPEQTRKKLIVALKIDVFFDDVSHPAGRVLVFTFPPHPIGLPVAYEGVAYMREADSLVPLSEHRRRQIYAEGATDFTARVCEGATWDDLAPKAVEDFRRRWIEKSRNPNLASLDAKHLLRDADALADGDRVTYAALILFGTRPAVRRLLPQAEVIFEYRPNEAPGQAADREEYQEGFFLYYDALWQRINLRNDRQALPEGFFVSDVLTFGERPVREVVLNAVAHRDYQLGGSVFLRQYPRHLRCESAGGLPAGITPQNIISHQSPRNRRVAELFAKCGLVERSGQAMDLMFQQSVSDSKPLPSFDGTDDYAVHVTLRGEVQDPRFVHFMSQIDPQRLGQFSTNDFLVLDLIRREEPIPDGYKPNVRRLRDDGLVETVGRGRGVRPILSRHLYQYLGELGRYTRQRGLDREMNLQLLLQHLRDCRHDGAPLAELHQVLPPLSEDQVRYRLGLLQRERKAISTGRGAGGRWYAAEFAPTGALPEGGRTT